MNINNLVKLVEQRFKESGLEQLKKDNSPELFTNFTEDDIPTLKQLKYYSDYWTQTRENELNLEKLIIKKK